MFLAGRCQLGYGDEKRAASVLSGQTTDGGFHHFLRSGSMDIAHIHIQTGKGRPWPLPCWDIVKFQIQENL